jgi:hypothetical protein
MLPRIATGLIAVATGTAAIEASTYLDMLIRGRPPSQVPADTAGAIAQSVGISLDGGTEKGSNRRSGLGALLGYGAGLGLGVAYAVLEPMAPDLPLPVSGAGLGLAAMATTDVPATATGSTDPRRWGPSGWLSDLVPHLIYGLVVVAVYHGLRSD